MVEFTLNDTSQTLVCALNGKFGADVNELFSTTLNDKIEICRKSIDDPGKLKICFDMKNVSFIASAFIRICLATSRQVSEENFSIINASPMIKKTFKIAGLDALLRVS